MPLRPVATPCGGACPWMMESDGEGAGIYEADGDEDRAEEEPEEEPEEPPPAEAPQADPKSDRAFLLPSLFRDRAATVWLDYPAYMGMQREQGRDVLVELIDPRWSPAVASGGQILNLG